MATFAFRNNQLFLSLNRKPVFCYVPNIKLSVLNKIPPFCPLINISYPVPVKHYSSCLSCTKYQLSILYS